MARTTVRLTFRATFNALRRRCDLEREVQPDLLALAQHNVVISCGLKAGECCRQRIGTRLQARKHEVTAFIREPRVHDTGIDVSCRNFDAGYQRARSIGDCTAQYSVDLRKSLAGRK